MGETTIVYLADPSVFEREDKSIVPPGVSHTQLGFPAGGMHGSWASESFTKRLRKKTKPLIVARFNVTGGAGSAPVAK